jgi:hypothetical protein
MFNLVAGLVLLYLVLVGIKQFARLSPAVAARLVRQSGGALGLVGALLLLMRGSIGLASLVATVAFGFAGWGKLRHFASGLGKGGARPAGGQKSTARSAMFEMRLDHATGELSGIVLAGPWRGRTLESFTRPDCLALYAAARRDDPDGAHLLETYLDRRFAGWRETAQDDRDGRAGRSGSGAMTPQEAYQVLGLAQGADAEEIARAHRTLMKEFHPDHGGSTSMAARVNQAKDVLLRRH